MQEVDNRKKITFTSDYSNDNKITFIQRDDGDIIISTSIKDESEHGVHFATGEGGTRLRKNGYKILKKLSEIMDLLEEEKDGEIVF